MSDDLERRLRQPLPDLPATIRPLELGDPSIEHRVVLGAGKMAAAGGGQLPLALLIVGFIVGGILISYGVWSRSASGVGAPQSAAAIVTASPTASSVGLASLTPSPPPASPSPSPSFATTTVTVPLGGTHAVVVTIDDQSGDLLVASPMSTEDGYQVPRSYGGKIAAWNPTGKPSTEVWLFWGGVICDTTTELVIGPGVTAMKVTDGPYPACDASNNGRGLVLIFSRTVDAASINVSLVLPPPTQ